MLFIYEVVIIFMLYVEYKYYKSYFTPFSILGCCYMTVPVLILIVGGNSQLYPMSEFNLQCTLFFLFLMWITGSIVRVLAANRKLFKSKNIIKNIKKIELLGYIFFLLYIFCIFMFMITVIRVLSVYGYSGAKNHTTGIGAHFGYIALMLTPYIVYRGVSQKRKGHYFFVLILILELILLQNKLPAIVLLLQSVYSYFMMSGRVRGKKIIKTGIFSVLAAMLLFIVVYSIKPWLIDKDTSFQAAINYSIERFFHYFFSGFISSNEYFMCPSGNTFQNGHRVAYGVFDTLKELFSENPNYVSPVIEKWVYISPISATNVGGMFSELVYQIGFFESAIYVIAVSIMVYFFYHLTCSNQIFVNTTSYLMTMTTLGFFCNFFSLFSTFEKLIYVMIFDLIIWKVKVKRTVVKMGSSCILD